MIGYICFASIHPCHSLPSLACITWCLSLFHPNYIAKSSRHFYLLIIENGYGTFFFILRLVVVISHGRLKRPKDQGLLEMESLMPKAIANGRPAFWKGPTLSTLCTNTGLVGTRDMRDIRLLCMYRGQHRNMWEHTALIVLVIGNVTRNWRVLQQIHQTWKVRQYVCLVCVFPGLWYFAGTLSWIKRWR